MNHNFSNHNKKMGEHEIWGGKWAGCMSRTRKISKYFGEIGSDLTQSAILLRVLCEDSVGLVAGNV